MPDLITVDDARLAANIPVTDTSHDEQLAALIPVATDLCENLAGPIMVAERTWTVDGGKTFVLLPSAASAIVSVTETGNVLTPAVDYTANLVAGIVYRGTIASPFVFLSGFQNVTVTYEVGYAADEDAVLSRHKAAARIVLAQLYQADLQGFRTAYQNGAAGVPAGFAMPARAADLLRVAPNLPGFA